MIEVRGLSKEYAGGVQALDDVSLDVEPGQFVALIGPSGAGKSSLLRCLNGFVTPTAGRVTVDGAVVTGAGRMELRRIRARIGFVFQQFNLLRRLSVLDNVLVGRLAHASGWRSAIGWFAASDVARAGAALDRVGLGGLGDRRADTLSGGQQQRVAIARALVQEPRTILADEPMSSLDPALAESVMELLREINQQDGITVITSLHVLELAKSSYASALDLPRREALLVTALKEHEPKNPLWTAQRDLWEANRQIVHLEDNLKIIGVVRVRDVLIDLYPDNTPPVHREHVERLVVEQARRGQATPEDADAQRLTLDPTGPGLVVASWNGFTLLQEPVPVVVADRLKTALQALLSETSGSETAQRLRTFHAARLKALDQMETAADTLSLRHIVPGFCSFCPV